MMAHQLQEFSRFFSIFSYKSRKRPIGAGHVTRVPKWGRLAANPFELFRFLLTTTKLTSGTEREKKGEVDQRQTNFKSLIKAAGDVTKATPSIGPPVGKIRSASDLFPARLTFPPLPYQGIKETEKSFVRFCKSLIYFNILTNFTPKNLKCQSTSDKCTNKFSNKSADH